MKQLSIIVPIYKVEKYVHQCLESIFRQGMDDEVFEVILVNDGTPDKSIEVITDIIEAHQNIHIIEQENQGLSMARNNGMKIATGEYILFVDSDDMLIENTLPYLINKAILSKADLVVADFIKMNDEQITQFLQTPFLQTNGDVKEKTGKDLLLQDLNPHYCCVWRALYKRSFLNNSNIRFIPDICFEDVPFTHRCYVNANLCLRINWHFIIYRTGNESITSSFNTKKGLDYCVIISKTWEISHEKILNKQIKQKIQNNAFAYFSTLFYSLSSCNSVSRSEKIYILNTLRQSVPDLAFKNGVKQKMVTFLYQRMPYTYLTLRIFYADCFQNLFWKIIKVIRDNDN